MPDTAAQPQTDPRPRPEQPTTRQEAAEALQRSLDRRGQGGGS
jgi:hypothetical protein